MTTCLQQFRRNVIKTGCFRLLQLPQSFLKLSAEWQQVGIERWRTLRVVPADVRIAIQFRTVLLSPIQNLVTLSDDMAIPAL